jgi:hypothetical protein
MEYDHLIPGNVQFTGDLSSKTMWYKKSYIVLTIKNVYLPLRLIAFSICFWPPKVVTQTVHQHLQIQQKEEKKRHKWSTAHRIESKLCLVS